MWSHMIVIANCSFITILNGVSFSVFAQLYNIGNEDDTKFEFYSEEDNIEDNLEWVELFLTSE